MYITDAHARKDSLDPQQRLQLHQEESQPRMAALEKWMQNQFTERIIEPNSSLGAAILYMQRGGRNDPVPTNSGRATG